MKIMNSLRAAGRALKKPVLAWGVFDGVHRGHQSLINALAGWAGRTGAPSLVITFDGHPDRVIHPLSGPLFISSLGHRLRLLEKLRVDAVLVLKFDRRFSRIPAPEFISRIIRSLSPSGVIATANVYFGRGGRGDIGLLSRTLGLSRIPLRVIKPLKYKGRIISSSRIRRSVRSGNLSGAQNMLGRSVSILGTVVRGAGRGRKLGFPTANLDPDHEILPKRGVYLARAACLSGRRPGHWLRALVNIGIKPTFKSDIRRPGEDVEAFLLGYNAKKYGNLYGRKLLLEITRRLRPERKFRTPELLIRRIKADLAQISRS